LSSQRLSHKLHATEGVIHADIGDVLWTMGRINEASFHYLEAYTLLKKAKVSPKHPVVYSIRTRFPEIIDSYRKELLIDRDRNSSHNHDLHITPNKRHRRHTIQAPTI